MYSSNLFKVHYFIEYIASFKMAYLKNICIDKREQLKKIWNVISKYLKAWHQIRKQLNHYLRFLLLILNRYLEYWIELVSVINSRIRKAHKHISWGKEKPSYF